MIILSYGMPKSASSFVFQLVSEMASLAGHNQLEIRNRYLDEDKRNVFQMLDQGNCESIFGAVPANVKYIVKTHGSFCEAIEHALASGKVTALATFRDPLDIAVSLLDAGKKERENSLSKQRADFAHIFSLQDTIKIIDWSVVETEKWLSNPFVKNIPYKNIFNDAEGVTTELQHFLGLGNNAAAACEKYLSNKDKILEFNVGGIDRWKNRLTDEEVRQLMDRYKDFRTRWI